MPAPLGVHRGIKARLCQQLEIVFPFGCQIGGAHTAVRVWITRVDMGEHQLPIGREQPQRERDRFAPAVAMVYAHDHLAEHGSVSFTAPSRWGAVAARLERTSSGAGGWSASRCALLRLKMRSGGSVLCAPRTSRST